MESKFVIITGASGSMGRVAVKAMAAEGCKVIMACRNLEKGESVRQDILLELDEIPEENLQLVQLDLESRTSVREFADKIKSMLQGGKIDALFNNAGVIAREYSVGVDGIEKTMAVNYLNPALLTRLLLPYFKEGGNIVNMVSLTTKYASLNLDWPDNTAKNFGQLKTYSSSKLAFLYFSIALARRFPGIHVNVSDPGVVNSNMISMGRWFDPLADILFRPFISSPEKGAASAIAALHSKSSMRYFVGGKNKAIPEKFTSSPIIDDLWDQASELLALNN